MRMCGGRPRGDCWVKNAGNVAESDTTGCGNEGIIGRLCLHPCRYHFQTSLLGVRVELAV